jgi:hypothetical protein
MSFRLAACLVLASSPALADVITSTTTGGLWHVSTTWVGGIIPDGNDDVILQGPVVVLGSAACLTLQVVPSGGLASGLAQSTIRVGGAVTNAGTIADGPIPFRIEIGGDLTNNAQWTNQHTTFTGMGSHHLTTGAGSNFESNLAMGSGATGDVIVETPLAILGDVVMGSGRMLLEPGCPLTMRQGALSGPVLCNGNEIRFESWSYISGGTFDQAVLVGEVEAAGGTFTGGLTVMDVLQNFSAGAGITIEGGLVNHGLIRNINYGFNVRLSGDLSCNGVIDCPTLELDEATIHHFTMGPQGNIDTPTMLPEFVPGTIVVESDVRFSDGVFLGIDGTMILNPGVSVHLANRGSLSGGTVLAGGNTILMDGMGSLSGITIDNAVLQGTIPVSFNCAFTSGVIVEGTLTTSSSFLAPEVTVSGRLLNTGVIQDGTRPVTIRAHGDVANEGAFTNAHLFIDGTEDQAVAIGGGIAVPEIVIESGLNAIVFQWFRDGQPIPGENSSTLTFAGVTGADIGNYWCDGDGVLSRTISVMANTAGVPGSTNGAPTITMLAGARPNPFRGATAIDFALDGPGSVRLSAFDVAGRLVAVLVDEHRAAGRHAVSWQAEDLAPGVYFLRLEAGSTRVVKKITRLE